MKNNYQYYVEGNDEKKLIDCLKNYKNQKIISGKIAVFNVIQDKISQARVNTLSRGTVVILIFDTDKPCSKTLIENIEFLKNQKNIKEVWCVEQVSKLEDELKRSTNINKIEDLLGSMSAEEFKSDIIKEKRLAKKLEDHQFDLSKMWTKTPEASYNGISNNGNKIKL